ncbi:phosphoheptose isomerase [Thermoanaerobacter sp. YS13]|uniref:D-sedoheptulose-7-phosphate isomerase n=1 Tax=Thermoanaerobacter sp. YS13 TaxID=1511746 RepID=UPI000575A3E0|nr:SIS domain-containing protein [Thermoanaerobacter sp. YS13]KHO62709.1 phosphoheptose isomerase [Thermoanaerobacter sp. YS13]
MKKSLNWGMLDELVSRFPELKYLESSIKTAVEVIIESYEKGGKLLVCGNGGSAADSEHIVGELLKGFMKKRPLNVETINKLKKFDFPWGNILAEKLQGGLPAISLTAHTAFLTAFMNDVDPDLVFAQQVFVLGKKEDILIALTTSGNSRNILYAIYTAKALEMTSICFTGESGGKAKEICDVLLNVPANVTHKVQEYYLPIYHTICGIVEEYFFKI